MLRNNSILSWISNLDTDSCVYGCSHPRIPTTSGFHKVVVITLASHARGPGFEPQWKQVNFCSRNKTKGRFWQTLKQWLVFHPQSLIPLVEFYLNYQQHQVDIFTARKRSLRQGNVFTGVCLSTAGWSLYDVTSCPADWSHVLSGGSLSLVLEGSLSRVVSVLGGLCPG